ncbi:pickpocket protein 28-like [Belonocnema kinseyi]|uniref:pickpocket protein 28-like n=1 Tax=Belonocnema kinseyi TaxID=2817044 RepID=UPI00143DBC3F|nr:pickpocket protein 28-like [Belonocnema kinseyi]
MDTFQKQEIIHGNLRNSGKLIKIPSRKQKRRLKHNLSDELRHFCKNTTLHGFRYITAEEKSTAERVIWSLVCISFLLLALTMMVLVWYRFSKTPTTTTIDTTTYPIWDLPFPAITICNHNKVYLPKARTFTKDMLKFGFKQQEIDRLFDLLPQLIRPAFANENFTHVPAILESLGLSTEELMKYLMQPCEKMLLHCGWLDKIYDCNKIFKVSKTSEGFCCSFNYHFLGEKPLNKTDKDDDNSKSPYETTDNLPGVNKIQMVPGAGRGFGLAVTFDVESQYYRGSIRPYIGASILVHHPVEFPEVDLRSAIIQPSQEVSILLSGTMIESEPGVRNLPVDLRNCWFEDEKKLKISSSYGYHSCVSQCRIRFIVENCKCVPFYYPQIYKRICGLEDINCLQSIRKNILELQTLNDVNAYFDNSNEEAACQCFPLCSDKWYTLNTESAYMEHFDHNYLLLNELDLRNISTAVVFFRDITCVKYRRDKWKSWNDVIASLGGILGLCVGGSFVSVAEIIYFFIINGFFKKKPKKVPLKPTRKGKAIQNIQCPINSISSNISNADNLHKSELNMKKNLFIERTAGKTNKTNEILHYFSNDQ